MNVKSSNTAHSTFSHQFRTASKRPLKTRFIKGITLALVLGALSGGGYGLYRQFLLISQQQEKTQHKTVAVETVTLPITVSASGVVDPEQTTNVSPKISGRLERVMVEEGNTVKAGQILAYMDASDLQGQLIQAQGQLKAARANLAMLIAGNRPQETAQIAANLASAEADLNQAEATLRRYEALYSQGAVSTQEVAKYRTARDTAQAKVEAAQQALDLSQAGSRQEEIVRAKAEVTQAKGALTTIQTKIEDAVIRAPFSGIVTARYANPGDFVAPETVEGESFSSSSSSILSLASYYQVAANVAETDITKIQTGQPVSIWADAYPDQNLEGHVTHVAEQATVVSNVTSFEVRIDFSETAQIHLRPGMNVEVEFRAGELPNVLVAPTVAIVRQEQGEGVFVMTETGDLQFRPVETGLTVDNQTEIRDGLNGNEQIVINAAQGLPAQRRSFGVNPLLLPGGRPSKQRKAGSGHS